MHTAPRPFRLSLSRPPIFQCGEDRKDLHKRVMADASAAAPAQTFEARLVRARALAPNVRDLAFERVDGRPMTFVPGQWVSALLGSVDGASEMKRSYSIASAPDGSPRFEIAVTRVQGGPGSTRLHALEPGAVLRFVGPQGFFTRTSPASEL